MSAWLGGRPGDMWNAAPGAPRGEMAESDENVGKLFEWSILGRMLAYALPYKRRALVGVAGMLVLQGMHLVQPLLEGAAIDRVVAGDFSGLLLITGGYLATLFLAWLAQYHQIYQMTWAGQHVLYQLASDMFNHIVRLSMSFFDRNEIGRIMSRVQSDVQILQQLLSSGLIVTIGNALSVTGIIVTMFALNWRLALLAVGLIPLFIIGLMIWQSYARRAFRGARAAISRVSANLQEDVSGVRVIQSLGREGENFGQFEQANAANMQASILATRVGGLTQPMVEIMTGLALGLVIFFGGGMVIEETLTIGLLYAFTRYVVRFFEPVRMLTQEYNQLQRAAIAAERIFEVLDTVQEVKEAPNAVELPTIQGRVTYEDVYFSYELGVPVLRDFSLDIAPGERIAVVGPTGAGKSTLVSLLMRFYDVTGGRILVDGYDIRDLKLDSLRRQIGIVLQEPVLFSGTIADNIRYARPAATDDEVEAAARAVGADAMIQRLERGYATPVQERGVGLSVGERQLIAFARALFADPRILVLDEATANLDTASELIVQRAIRTLTAGRTSLIIAHRLSTIRDADRTVVLENGRIVEMGDHQSLLDQGGVYHRLYSLGFQAPATSGPVLPSPQLA